MRRSTNERVRARLYCCNPRALFKFLRFRYNNNLVNNKNMEAVRTTPIVAAATGKACKMPSRVGRGLPDITSAYIRRCSCHREKTIVFCRACGYYCHGRIRLKCDQHPRVTFLLDIAECPRCLSSVFMDEYCGSS